MALLLYVLSVGPVARYYGKMTSDMPMPPGYRFVEAFYYPILCLRETPLEPPLDFYVRLWVGE